MKAPNVFDVRQHMKLGGGFVGRWMGAIALGTIVFAAGPLRAATVDFDEVELALRVEDYDRADRLTSQRIADGERDHGPSLPTLHALDQRVELLLESERHDLPEAAAAVERELELARKLTGAASRESARANLHAARRDFQRADYRAFRTSIATAVASSRALATNDVDRAEIELLAAQGDYHVFDRQRQGMRRAARALATLRAAEAERPRALVRALCAYGRMQRDVQETEASVQTLRECERRSIALAGADSAAHSRALSLLGYALRERGEYAAGTEALEKSVEIAARTKPYNQSLHVRSLMLLGTNLEMLGDFARARTALETAGSLQEQRPTLNPFEHATLLSNLATHYYYSNDLKRALEYDGRGLPLLERVLGRNALSVRMARINHAALLQESGQLDDAASIYDEEIAAFEAAPMPGDGLLLSYANLAEIRLRQGRYSESEALYQRFLRRLGEGRDLAETTPSGALAGIAAARWGQKRHAAAFDALRRAQRSSMRARYAALGELSERQMLSLASMSRDYSGLAVAIATDSGDADLIEQAWQLVLEADGMVTRRAALRLAEANKGKDGGNGAAWREWRAASGALSAARVAAAKHPSKDSIAAFDRAQNRIDRSERRLAAIGAASGSELAADLGDLAGVRADLAPDTALVRYLEIDVARPQSYRNDRGGEDRELFALLGRHDGRARALKLGPIGPIADGVDRWHRLASSKTTDAASMAASAKELQRLLIAPLAFDAQVERVHVVASAALHRLNFAALAGEDDRYLLESGPAFHLLNHEREILLPHAPNEARSLLLAGAATGSATQASNEFDSVMRKACPGVELHALDPLPGAASELDSLRELAQDRAGKIDVLSGAAATEAAVRAAMPTRSIIHLATHAFALGERCSDGDALRSIALEPVAAGGSTADAPNLSGLSALAFLPQRRSDGAYDGLLTSEEVATLNLSAADWVVLSACETALGQTRAGEGVFGLRRAFRLAGARTVVMSLWRVEDRATAEFMRELYQARLLDRLDTPAAMQTAMRATLQARRRRGDSTHPLYWAGFVAAGAWR